jgi:hypothetical protein
MPDLRPAPAHLHRAQTRLHRPVSTRWWPFAPPNRNSPSNSPSAPFSVVADPDRTPSAETSVSSGHGSRCCTPPGVDGPTRNHCNPHHTHNSFGAAPPWRRCGPPQATWAYRQNSQSTPTAPSSPRTAVITPPTNGKSTSYSFSPSPAHLGGAARRNRGKATAAKTVRAERFSIMDRFVPNIFHTAVPHNRWMPTDAPELGAFRRRRRGRRDPRFPGAPSCDTQLQHRPSTVEYVHAVFRVCVMDCLALDVSVARQ